MSKDLTGSIHGTVVDDKREPLIGVVVSEEGSEPGDRMAVTDAKGEYRFVELPPGQYTLTFTMTGFSNIRIQLVVGLGQTQKPTTVMIPSSVE